MTSELQSRYGSCCHPAQILLRQAVGLRLQARLRLRLLGRQTRATGPGLGTALAPVPAAAEQRWTQDHFHFHHLRRHRRDEDPDPAQARRQLTLAHPLPRQLRPPRWACSGTAAAPTPAQWTLSSRHLCRTVHVQRHCHWLSHHRRRSQTPNRRTGRRPRPPYLQLKPQPRFRRVVPRLNLSLDRGC